jgi:hypothetical protein
MTSLGGETVFSLNQKRVEQLEPKLPRVSNAGDLVSFKEEVRSRLRQAGRFELPEGPLSKAALQVRPFGEIRRAGYRIEKLTYESEPEIVVPSLLFIPDTSEAHKPAILYVHGRGKSAEAASGGDILQLVKAGFVVLAIDTRGCGETQVLDTQQSNDTLPYFGDYDSAMTALLAGKPLVAMRALDVSRGVDLLLSRPEVDSNRVYGFGKEAGTVPLLYACVLDDRIKKVVLEGMIVSYRSIIDHRIHRQVFENVVLGALKFYDFPDLVAALAPRPIWVVNSVDPLGHRVAKGEVKKQYASALEVFRLAGAEAALRVGERRADEPLASPYADLLEQH